MTDAELSSLEAAARAATPGPWTTHGRNFVVSIESRNNPIIVCDCLERKDAKYVESVQPAAILEMIAEVRQLQIERDWLAEKCESIAHALDPCEFYPAYYWKDQARQYIEEIACQKN